MRWGILAGLGVQRKWGRVIDILEKRCNSGRKRWKVSGEMNFEFIEEIGRGYDK